MAEELIENKVDKSGLITFNLEDYYVQGERVLFDIKECLYEGLILREKDFREFVKAHNWSSYSGKFVAVTCSADAIVPTWAYMLIASELEPFAKDFIFGNLQTLETLLFQKSLALMNLESFKDERVIIKGCSKYPVPESAYVELVKLLRPIAKSIMFGEACSTVPLYKRKG
jgi:hypothetical protein